jgi:inosine-uridine nucleoside N-ribohydrolase
VTTLIHLDTDIGGDTDDLCALAMLLGWPGVELAGVTTSIDASGLRAGCARAALRLAGRGDVPVAAGSEGSLGGFRAQPGLPDLTRYWGEPISPAPSPPGAAPDLLARNIERGATVVAIGPWTNLALLEAARPGLLAPTRVVVMGGYVRPVRAGLPPWGQDMDYNVQEDVVAARIVVERCAPLIAPLHTTLEVSIREAHLPRLREGGPLARLIAHQSALHGADNAMPEMGRAHADLPDDLLNFQYDPLACAAAVGWDGLRVEDLGLAVRAEGGLLTFPEAPGGIRTQVVTGVDARRFEEAWLEAVLRVRG